MQTQFFKRNLVQHHLALSRWMLAHGATGSLDPATLRLQLSLGGKDITFYPQFNAQTPQGMSFVNQLMPGVNGFVGYYPFVPKAWPWAQSKFGFKAFAQQSGLRIPAWGRDAAQVKGAYLIKSNRSSFGKGQRGPFLQAPDASTPPEPLQEGEYYEQFLFGKMLKAWYWNAEPVVVDIVDMASVLGNGEHSVETLIAHQHPMSMTHTLSESLQSQRQHLLALQASSESSIPAKGQRIIIDYQFITLSNPSLYEDYDCRQSLRGTAIEQQLREAGRKAWEAIPAEQRQGGISMSLDAMMDASGTLWFLEGNCNPQLPPGFYEHMLDDLFAEQLAAGKALRLESVPQPQSQSQSQLQPPSSHPALLQQTPTSSAKSSSSIRFATAADIPGLVQLGARVHALSRFKRMAYDQARVAQALHAAITDTAARYVCFVAEDGQGQVVGVLLATLERHIFSADLTASIMHFDVLPEKRAAGYALRLIKAFETWCTNRQVAEIAFGINSVEDEAEIQRLAQFARRLGYRKVGESFVK